MANKMRHLMYCAPFVPASGISRKKMDEGLNLPGPENVKALVHYCASQQ
jgi:hypothetical protein